MPESSAAERVGREGNERRAASLHDGSARRLVLLVIGQVDAAGVEVVLEDLAVATPLDDGLEHALGPTRRTCAR